MMSILFKLSQLQIKAKNLNSKKNSQSKLNLSLTRKSNHLRSQKKPYSLTLLKRLWNIMRARLLRQKTYRNLNKNINKVRQPSLS